MATAEELRRSIEPGSIPFGERAPLEQGLPDVAQTMNVPGNPLDMLLGGKVRPDESPVTAGLSVGPGPGPNPDKPSSRVEKLRLIALHAQSPVLRATARRALQTAVRAQSGI